MAKNPDYSAGCVMCADEIRANKFAQPPCSISWLDVVEPLLCKQHVDLFDQYKKATPRLVWMPIKN